MGAVTVLWLTTIVMAVGGGAILAIGQRRTAQEEAHTILHGLVPLIAACAYLAMAVGHGAVTLPAGASTRVFYYARYIDWTFTTPLLLLTLALTAMHSGARRWGAVTGMLLADVMMIVAGFAFAAGLVPWVKFTWFVVSCGAFLGVFYVMWGPLIAESQKEVPEVQADYRKQAKLLTALWCVYPVLIGISPDGLGWLGETITVLLVAVIDVVAKVVFGLISVQADRAQVGRDLVPARA